ncbi:hypothetical protein [Nonomuraea salmonea]|uniref:hypothetical protein n=1 Tax=Nonomuraea salmonea TaxID=46181 RepID=UPI0031E6A536
MINAAGSLLTLSMEQGRAQRAAERSLRAAVLELLLAGGRRSGPGRCWAGWAAGCPPHPWWCSRRDPTRWTRWRRSRSPR